MFALYLSELAWEAAKNGTLQDFFWAGTAAVVNNSGFSYKVYYELPKIENSYLWIIKEKLTNIQNKTCRRLAFGWTEVQ
jgi:hypothetical protein